jgi:putative DNA primase/helicase
LEPGQKATKELQVRREARKRFAVTTKNKNRIDAMQALAAPRLRRAANSFNSDPLLTVTENATLRFVVEDDPECPVPDVHRPMARLEVLESHRREDYATGLLPCVFDADAVCPAWNKFLDRCLPDADVQRMVRAYSALGILGMTAQKLMFHHGLGANAKGVFLTVLGLVIGQSYRVSLSKETILGQGERGAGQASPDLVRLFAKRFVRIHEMKEGEVLREDLVKRLTGGDMPVVRNLHRGYLEFPNVAAPHMSGNGKPKNRGHRQRHLAKDARRQLGRHHS